MASKNKLQLLMELSDKMFNSGLNRVQNKLNSSVNAMEGRLNQFKIKASRSLNSFATEAESSLSFGFGAGFGMKIFDLATNAISNLSGEAINSADSLEKFKSTMSFAGFDTGQIDVVRNAVKKYADDTVYDLSTISNTTAQLASNGVKDFMKLTQAGGNLNAVAGGNADTFKSVALVLTQVNGAGKLVTQDWNQIANAIPGASGKLQEAMLKNGAYTGNFREAMEKGLISADHFNKAIMDLGFQQVAIDAAKSTSTFEGAIGQLEAGVVNALTSVIDAIGMDNITGVINSVTSVVEKITSGFKWLFDGIRNGNPLIQILATVIGSVILGLTTYVTVVNGVLAVTKLWSIYQTALNATMIANPIGIIVGAITALIAIVVIAIKKYDEWGAALIAFLGPIGLVINGFKSLYDHWDSIKKAFQTDGITGALKRIGVVLLDAVLKPIKQALELLKDYDPTGLSKNMLGKIDNFRANMDLVTSGENKIAQLTNKSTSQASQSLYGSITGSGGDGKKSETKIKKQADRLNQMTGGANQVRNVTINVDSFVKGGLNVSQSATKGMSKEDVESWFIDVMQRVMLNAEHS